MASTLSIAQLIQGLTPNQVKGKIYDVVSQLGVPTTNWKPGSVVRLIISACSIVLSGLSITISLLAQSAFIGTASSDWLTIVALYVFGVNRAPASSAAGLVTFTNSQGGSWVFNPGDVTVSNQNGFTYKNTEVFTISTGPGATVSVNVAATLTGTGSSTGRGTILNIVSPTLPGVTITNPNTLVGQDLESDSALQIRCLAKPQSLSPNGPRGAYQYFAMNALRSDGTAVGVNRATVSSYSSTGRVGVVVATPSGALSGNQSDPNTDLGAVYSNLILNAVPQCVTLTVTTAYAAELDVTFWAYFDGNTNVTSAEQVKVVTDTLNAWLPSIPIGGISIPGVVSNIIPKDTLRDVISEGFVTAGYPRPLLVKIITPSTDLTLTPTQVAEPHRILAQAA